MTLKNWFFSSLKEDRKRRVWTIVVFGLLCFIMTVFYELNIEVHELNVDSMGSTLQESLELFTRQGMLGTYLIFSCIGAVLFGFQGFGWLTRKEEVDFYHSQPMKRGTRFLITYLNGLLLFEIPMLLHLVVGAVFIGARGCLNTSIIVNLLANALIFTVAFIMLYSLVVLAVMLTGNIIVSIMASAVFFFYSSAVRHLLNGYCSVYFGTFSNRYSSPMAWLGNISPVEQLIGLYSIPRNDNLEAIGSALLWTLGIGLILFVLSYYSYKKRSSECAGRALTFPVMGSVIRILIVIPICMVAGLLFTAFSGINAVAWLYFGTVVGAILAHGFMEVVFQFDVKAAFNRKKQLLASIIVAMSVVSVFHFDLIGYDSYIPKENEVREISYYVNLGEYTDIYLKLDEKGVPYSVLKKEPDVNFSLSREKYQLMATKTEDVKPVLEIVKAHLADEKTEDENSTLFLVCYKLNGGKKVYRQYYIDNEVLKETYRPIYETEQGKRVIHPYLDLAGKEIDSIIAYAPFFAAAKPLDLTVEEMEELVECYKKDLKEREFEQLFEDRIIGTLALWYQNEAGLDETELVIYVSETYEHILSFLEEKDIFLELPNEDYVLESMIAYNPINNEETVNHPFWKGQSQVQLSKKQMDELIPLLCIDEYMFSSYQVDYRYHFEALVRNVKNGTLKHCYYYLKEQEIPEFLK